MRIDTEFNVGEKVWDDLTMQEATVIGITFEHGKKKVEDKRTASRCVGYWIDNNYLGGGRHPWELCKFRKINLCESKNSKKNSKKKAR